MDRIILHSDLNNFFASVECLYHPEVAHLPVAVCGAPEDRHGIVLAKNTRAKLCGVRTGEVIWSAKQKCPNLVILKPNYTNYLRYSKMAREVYEKYTDLIESFGIDECWLDVTRSTRLFGTGEKIADEIRQTIKKELGITVSIGVSWNKVYSKLGSDIKKPNATTVINRENYKEKIFGLPVDRLLYVGNSTAKKLHSMGIYTIGHLAELDKHVLNSRLGKWGGLLSEFARGNDTSPVLPLGEDSPIKSIGNSITGVHDLMNDNDVNMMLYSLSESVATRLRTHGFLASQISLSIRDTNLHTFSCQKQLPVPTALSSELAQNAWHLFKENWTWANGPAIRSIGISASKLSPDNLPRQLCMLVDEQMRSKQLNLEKAVDKIRERFGYFCITRACLLQDRRLANIDHAHEPINLIHPVSYF